MPELEDVRAELVAARAALADAERDRAEARDARDATVAQAAHLVEENRQADGAAIALAERLDAAEQLASMLRGDVRQADAAHAALAADLADERRRHTEAREARERVLETCLALWAENEVLRPAVDELTRKRAAEAGAVPQPDPWAQVDQLRADAARIADEELATAADYVDAGLDPAGAEPDAVVIATAARNRTAPAPGQCPLPGVAAI